MGEALPVFGMVMIIVGIFTIDTSAPIGIFFMGLGVFAAIANIFVYCSSDIKKWFTRRRAQ